MLSYTRTKFKGNADEKEAKREETELINYRQQSRDFNKF